MRRLLVGLVVAAVTVLVPIWASAGNQEVAEQIAAKLRQSGQLKDYKIGVKYQDGTAWLRGRVSSREQMSAALTLVFQTPGVTRVVNNLALDSKDEAAESTPPQVRQVAAAVNPDRLTRLASSHLSAPWLRVKADPDEAARKMSRSPGRADRVAATFQAGPARTVSATAGQEPALAPSRVAQTAPAAATQPAAPQASQFMPIAYGQVGAPMPLGQAAGGPIPQYVTPVGGGVAPARYDQPHVPNYTWPSYAAYPNYAALTYPKQYSPTVWPYIGPFYPYPQVPLGWRKVTLQWHDGWWQLDFDDKPRHGFISGLFRPCK